MVAILLHHPTKDDDLAKALAFSLNNSAVDDLSVDFDIRAVDTWGQAAPRPLRRGETFE